MYTNPVLVRCPYCPRPEAAIFVDAAACLDHRQADPDPPDWQGAALDEPQEILRFGRRTDRRVPCRHAVHMRGVVTWHGHEVDEDDPEDGPWAIPFEWTAPRFRPFDTGIGAVVVGSPDHLAAVAAACRPPAQVAVRRCDDRWDALPDYFGVPCEYSLVGLFLFTNAPNRLRSAVQERIEAIQEPAHADGGLTNGR